MRETIVSYALTRLFFSNLFIYPTLPLYCNVMTISPRHRLFFLLATGAASTAAEITGLRLLAPVFGTSLPVWGAAIATVIGGLALGYHWGGKKASAATTYSLVFAHAAVAALFFLILPFGMAVALWLRMHFFAGPAWPIGLNALIIAWMTLLPPSILFGMISPLAIQADTTLVQQQAGAAAGSVFTLTTIGSLLGILVPSFITIPLLGTKVTIWLFAGAVLVLTLPIFWQHKRLFLFFLGIVGASGASFFIPRDPSILVHKDTAYQYVTVKQFPNGSRALIFDAGFGIQSVLPVGLYTDAYWDYSGSLPLLLPHKKDLSVLVLGAAVSTTERQMTRLWEDTKTFNFTSVELDPAIFEIADQYFDPPQRTKVVSDARFFLHQDTKHYDLILVDAYTRELTVPFHLATHEFFDAVSHHSTDDGIVAVNINSKNIDTLFIKSVARTVQSVFPYTAYVHTPQSCNYVLLASKNPFSKSPSDAIPNSVKPIAAHFSLKQLPSTKGFILTDNKSPTDLLGMAALYADAHESICAS